MKGFRTKKHMVVEPWSVPYSIFIHVPNPREGNIQGLVGLYRVVANWLIRNNIQTIVGPVCSGAVMAYAISSASNGKIQSSFAPKANKKYKPAVYDNRVEIRGDYVVVDDTIASGKEIVNTINECVGDVGDLPKAILCFDTHSPYRLKRSKYSGVPVFKMGFRRQN